MSENKILRPVYGGEADGKQAARKNDLSTRERVNFVVSSALMEELRERSSKEEIPMSRMIDAALANYLNKPSAPYRSASMEKGVVLYHLLEILLGVKSESDTARQMMACIQLYFKNYTFSSCLLKSPSNKTPTIGTKIILYLSDAQSESLTCFIEHVSRLEGKQYMEVFLDGKTVSV